MTRSTDGQAFRWQILNNAPRPCPTAQLWRPAKPSHVSNGALITVNAAGQIFLRCLHSECRARSGGQRWYVGSLPASISLRQSESVTDTRQTTSIHATRKRAANQNLDRGPVQPHSFAPTRRRIASGYRADTCEDRLDASHSLEEEAEPSRAEDDVAQPPTKGSTPVVRRPPLSFPSSMVRVLAENQAGEIDSFRPWHECPGPHGGRAGGVERRMAEDCRQIIPASTQVDVEELSAWSAHPFFSTPAPASLIAAQCERGTGCEQ